ncbi:MAG: hypothetical protein M1541_07655 [Acidobacteria bacterium]|nr:hypothetical protein [Acidobacteriota bacterium]
MILALFATLARADASAAPNPEPVEGIQWKQLLTQSAAFVGIMHGFRLATEPGTRHNLGGAFWRGYTDSVGNLHGWGDGDPVYVNYIGHPMQGAVSGRLFNQNDPQFRRAVFGRNAPYWKSRLRSAAFAWAFSTQFEIGPLSEATIGKIQNDYPQQGFVDHVITPFMGMAWMVAEDAVDKYAIERIERLTYNPWVRLLARGSLNPTRSLANVLRGKVPWYRDTRSGVLDYDPAPHYKQSRFGLPSPNSGKEPEATRDFGVANAEIGFVTESLSLSPRRGAGGCLGGGGEFAYRMAPAWQMVLGVGGCKMLDPGDNRTGDALTYLIGPRWTAAPAGHWSPYVQFLIGGEKLTWDRTLPDLKAAYDQLAIKTQAAAPQRPVYLIHEEASGLALDFSPTMLTAARSALTWTRKFR